jgi:serine/threonine protein kinase
MIDREFRAKVVDFGLVYAADEVFNGIRFGSPFYISPEGMEHKPEDFRSDLYSLGATLFHALAGRPPFDGQEMREVVQKVLNREIPDLAEIRPDVSPQTIAIINKLLQKNPEDRYSSHDQLIADLKNSLMELKKIL